MKKFLLLPVLLLLSTLVALGLARPVAADASARSPGRAGERGDHGRWSSTSRATRLDGFTLHYADGSSLSPPPLRGGHPVLRVRHQRAPGLRCRVEVQTWYRDLGDLKRSLAWVRRHG